MYPIANLSCVQCSCTHAADFRLCIKCCMVLSSFKAMLAVRLWPDACQALPKHNRLFALCVLQHTTISSCTVTLQLYSSPMLVQLFSSLQDCSHYMYCGTQASAHVQQLCTLQALQGLPTWMSLAATAPVFRCPTQHIRLCSPSPLTPPPAAMPSTLHLHSRITDRAIITLITAVSHLLTSSKLTSSHSCSSSSSHTKT